MAMELSISSSFSIGCTILAEYSGQSSKLESDATSFLMTTRLSLVETRGNFSLEVSPFVGTFLTDFKFPLDLLTPLDLLWYDFEELSKFLLDF